MAEKQKERESNSKDKSITKPLTKIKTKDDEVHICGEVISIMNEVKTGSIDIKIKSIFSS